MRGGGVNADGFGVGWYAGGAPMPARYRRATVRSGPTGRSPTLASVVSSGAVLAAVRSATVGHAGRRGGGRAVRRRGAGCSATTARSPAGRTSMARLAAALPVRRPAHAGRADRLGAAVGAGPAPAARPASDPAEALAARVPASPRSAAAVAAQPAAHRRPHDARPPRSGTRCRSGRPADRCRGRLRAVRRRPRLAAVPDRHAARRQPGRGRTTPLPLDVTTGGSQWTRR